MNTDSEWSLEGYDYELPEAQIAQHPAENRAGSRLCVVDRNGADSLHQFVDLQDFLPENALIVVNNSKVVPARMHGQSEAGKKAEFLLLTPLPLLEIMEHRGWRVAHCQGLLKGSKRFKTGDEIIFTQSLRFTLSRKEDFGRVEGVLAWKEDLETCMEVCGEPPLPPYIKRDLDVADMGRYQTVYANDAEAGSVAAPTAGLHFDATHLEQLRQKGLEIAEITLYVGYGTFSPIRCKDIREHSMHAEYVRISKETANAIQKAREEKRPVIAVGTTVVRTLEGVYLATGGVEEYAGWVNLFIAPGFKFSVVDHMITNFHLPKSSLLVLVSAFAGRKRILTAYTKAIESGFRVFSYGDAMLIL